MFWGEQRVNIGVGDIPCSVTNEQERKVGIRIKDALIVPGGGTNLLSVHQLLGQGFTVSITDQLTIELEKGDHVFIAEGSDRLWKLPIDLAVSKRPILAMQTAALVASRFDTHLGPPVKHPPEYLVMLTHAAYGHAPPSKLKRMVAKAHFSKDIRSAVLAATKVSCEACLQAKSKAWKLPKRSFSELYKKVLDLVVSDSCGPFPVQERGMLYMTLFKDVATSFKSLFFSALFSASNSLVTSRTSTT
jgi:hypothetical protein